MGKYNFSSTCAVHPCNTYQSYHNHKKKACKSRFYHSLSYFMMKKKKTFFHNNCIIIMSTRRHQQAKSEKKTQQLFVYRKHKIIFIFHMVIQYIICSYAPCTHIKMCKHLYNLRLSNVLENRTKKIK